MSKNDHSQEGLRYYNILRDSRFLLAKILKRFAFSEAEIEDISQEALVRALEAREKADVRYPKQFLISIAKNVAREENRRRARQLQGVMEDNGLESHLLDRIGSSEPDAEAVLDGRQKMRLFVAAVASLPPQCRRVFVMKHVQGATHKEISAHLNISVSTVEKHVAAGLKACKSKILAAINDKTESETVHYLFEKSDRNKKL